MSTLTNVDVSQRPQKKKQRYTGRGSDGQRDCENGQTTTDALHMTHQNSKRAGGYVFERQDTRKKSKGM